MKSKKATSKPSQFPTEEDMKGIHPARRGIIEIVKLLLTMGTKYKTRDQIFKALNYQPFKDRSEDAKRGLIHRIIACEDANKSRDEIAGIKYAELLAEMEEKFASYLTRTEPPIADIHHDYYIYYYESYNETTKEYCIKFAIVGFDRNDKKDEWESGKIYYINDSNQIGRTFVLKRIHPPETNSQYLFFEAKEKQQVNFYTFKTMGKDIEARGIVPLTYSVLETQFNFPCAGKALLEKSTHKKCIDKLQRLSLSGWDRENTIISPVITNTLFGKKFVLKDSVFHPNEKFISAQTEELNSMNGVWEGVHLRPDIDATYASAEKGGICKFILIIYGSGECEYYWSDSPANKKFGFVEFPFNKSAIMRINLEYLKELQTYKLLLVLSAAPSENNNYAYKGIISGWVSIHEQIYTSAVYMKRIRKFTTASETVDIEKLLVEQKTMRISKTKVDQIIEIGKEYIEPLKRANGEFLATFEKCMPGDILDLIEKSKLNKR